jgi:bisphosphoglycerate-independent phosphoglycerate mutase (AlkP superfamily)
MEDWENATNLELADMSGAAMVDIAERFYDAVRQRDWERGERIAMTIAKMAAHAADACEMMKDTEGR